MKRIALAIVLLIAGFVAGYAYSDRDAFTDYQDERELTTRANAEMSVRLALINIKYAQAGKTRDVLRTNCFIARSSVPLVEPGFFRDPEKQKEVATLVGRAREVIAALESSGMCLGPRREG
jgi:hypothetical protein